MQQTIATAGVMDVVERVAALEAGGHLQALRQRRSKVATAIEGSHCALLDPALPGLSLADRLLVALHASLLSASPALAAHYRERLLSTRADARLVAAVERLAFHEAMPAGKDGEQQPARGLAVEKDARDADRADEAMGGAPAAELERLRPLLSFARLLIEAPASGEQASLQPLQAAPLDTAAIVALAQLVAFVSCQVRVIAGLAAMKAAAATGAAAPDEVAGDGTASGTRTAAGAAAAPAPSASGGNIEIVRVGGYTNEVLDWKAWLDVVELERASDEQIAVLDESHPQARQQDYYRLLVHQPEILRQRSAAFNAIMYAPRGLSRAERELGATVASRLNGCVYCASVHARRFEQMARRNEVIRQVFDDPRSAGGSDRERAIIRLSITLTESPHQLAAEDIADLVRQGLDDLEILDLVHAVAIFAWANRLMLTLGKPAAAATA